MSYSHTYEVVPIARVLFLPSGRTLDGARPWTVRLTAVVFALGSLSVVLSAYRVRSEPGGLESFYFRLKPLSEASEDSLRVSQQIGSRE